LGLLYISGTVEAENFKFEIDRKELYQKCEIRPEGVVNGGHVTFSMRDF